VSDGYAASLELNQIPSEDLIEEVDNLVGAGFLVTSGLDFDLAPAF
jgi:hypothetical protein